MYLCRMPKTPKTSRPTLQINDMYVSPGSTESLVYSNSNGSPTSIVFNTSRRNAHLWQDRHPGMTNANANRLAQMQHLSPRSQRTFLAQSRANNRRKLHNLSMFMTRRHMPRLTKRNARVAAKIMHRSDSLRSAQETKLYKQLHRKANSPQAVRNYIATMYENND
jgi:hypothetical protein